MRYFFQRFLLSLVFLGLGLSVQAQAPAESLLPGQSLGAFLGIASLPNLRDVGGYPTKDGAIVAKGKTYRTNAFYPMTTQDLQKLDVLRLKNDYDLRTTQEIQIEPDRVPVGVVFTQLNVLADDPGVAMPPKKIAELFNDPKAASKYLGGAQGVDATFKQLYRHLVSLPSAKKSYETLFLNLANSSTSPNAFHCTNGKDRTGWAAAALLTLLGVEREKVYEDYLLSNDYLLPFHQKEINEFVAKGGDKAIPLGVFGVKRGYLDAAFAEMQSRYGSIERYFEEGLHINAKQQQKLRELYLISRPKSGS